MKLNFSSQVTKRLSRVTCRTALLWEQQQKCKFGLEKKENSRKILCMTKADSSLSYLCSGHLFPFFDDKG
jgi:hypothetical protein